LLPTYTPTHTILFYFHSPHTHPDLHSFPTRRSSDLNSRVTRLKRQSVPDHERGQRTHRDRGRNKEETIRQCAQRRRPGQLSALRSEEHTSELQSPDHLVCRLLLEKKKKNIRR